MQNDLANNIQGRPNHIQTMKMDGRAKHHHHRYLGEEAADLLCRVIVLQQWRQSHNDLLMCSLRNDVIVLCTRTNRDRIMIRCLALTVSDKCLKLGCFQCTGTDSALEASHFMRYINSWLTYFVNIRWQLHASQLLQQISHKCLLYSVSAAS